MKYPVLDMVCHAKEPKSSDKINPNQTSFCLNINKRVFMKHPVLDMVCHVRESKSSDNIDPNQTIYN